MLIALIACTEPAAQDTGDTPQAPTGDSSTSADSGSNPDSGSNADSGATTDSGSNPDPVIVPEEGKWLVTSTTITLDECNAAALLANYEGLAPRLTHRSDTEFDLVWTEEIADACTLSGDGGLYTCLERPSQIDGADFGREGTLHLAATASGEFTATDAGAIEIPVEVTCTGADCDEIADLFGTSFPCDVAHGLDLARN